MRRRRRLLGLVAAACGGDDDDDGGAEDTEAPARRPKPKARKRPPQRSAEGTEAPAETEDDRGTDARRPRPTEETGERPSIRRASRPTSASTTRRSRSACSPTSPARSPRSCSEIVEAQEVYWDDVNAKGGIAGRQVELVIEDNAYDVAQNVEKYEIAQGRGGDPQPVTGSPHTAAIAQDLVDDDLIAIPLSWYSGWADPGARPERVRDVHELLHRVDERRRVAARRTATSRRWRSSRSRASTAATAPPAPSWPPRSSGSRSSTTAPAR